MAKNKPPVSSIFITGAGAGIGRATAELFAERGWLTGLFDVSQEGLAVTRDRLGANAERSMSGVLDVTDHAAFERALALFAERTGGGLDVMFNCAGILRMGLFDEIPLADYERELAINVMGVIRGCRLALPYLERGSLKRIVNMSSASAVYGTPDLAVYSATKFAVRGLTEALDLELGPRGIRVTDVMPGYVNTDMVSSQTFKPKSLESLGVHLGPDDVAKRVWDAAHDSAVHYFLQNDVALLDRVSGLIPGLGRRVMKKYSGK